MLLKPRSILVVAIVQGRIFFLVQVCRVVACTIEILRTVASAEPCDPLTHSSVSFFLVGIFVLVSLQMQLAIIQLCFDAADG